MRIPYIHNLVSTRIVGQKKEYLLGPIKFWSRDLFSRIYDSNKKIFGRYDFICLINSNLGEAFLFFKYYLSQLESNNAKEGKRTLVVTSKSVHLELAHTLGVKNIVCLSGASFAHYEKYFTFRGKEFLVVFSLDHYLGTLACIAVLGTHYFEEMSWTLGLVPASFATCRVRIPNQTARLARGKAHALGIDLHNFVMIIPHSTSCQDMDKCLLRKLVRKLVASGHHVLINSWEIFPIAHKKVHVSHRFTLPELFALAELTREIIAIRCGLVEFLADAQRPMTVISTCVKGGTLSEAKVLSGFSFIDIAPEYASIREVTQTEYKYEVENC